MKKQINSVTKFNSNNFKVKVGTTNKKQPSIIYIELETYIKPLEDKNSFSDYIIKFDKNTRQFVNSLIDKKRNCEKKFILITDIADGRINKNKKSYLDLQVVLKPLNENNESFKNLANNIYQNYVIELIDYVEKKLYDDNIECYKTKK